MLQKLTDQSLMPFGQHKGQKLANVPASYLIYIYENYKLHDNLKAYIKDNMDSLKMEKQRADREKYK